MCDAFISFRFADQKMAEYIVNQLSVRYGIQCWICSRDSSHGAQFRLEIPKIIRSVSVVVFLQSANANGSQEIASELDMAFTGGKVIIPFRLDHEETDYEYYTSGRDYIDGTKPTLEQRIRELAESISRITGKPLAVCSEEALEGAGDAEKTLLSVKPDCEDIFLGREALMEEIHSAFENDRNVLFLHGMGGIGKSQLAGQYYRRHRDFYTTVVFGKYEGSLAALIADDTVFRIKGMIRRIREDNTPQTDEEYAREKLAFLKRTADEHTLIILDNYDVESDPFFEDLTEKAEYRVLVTSRIRPERGRYHRIAVKELDDETLRDLFIEFADPEEEEICRDDPAFPELFAYTNRHTLTLTLIAKYMAEKSIDDIGEMLGKLKAQSLSVISDSRRADGFARVRDILRMASLNEDEKMFLRCLALMPLSGVKQEFFKRWCGDVFAARNYLANNLGLVIVNREQGTLVLHPVIREVVLEEMTPTYENCREFLEKCAMVGEDAIPHMWNMPYDEKAIHLDCYTSILQMISEITPETYPLYVNISYMVNFVGSYAQAMALHERIYAFACVHFGKETKEAMLILNRIAWKKSNCMIYDEALPYYKTVADWFIENPCYTLREAQSVIQSCGNIYYYLYKQTHNPSDLRKAFEYLDKYVVYGEKMIQATADESEYFKKNLKYQNDCVSRDYFRLYLEEKKIDLAEEYLEKYRNAVKAFSGFSEAPSADMAGYCRYYAKLKCEIGEFEDAREALLESYRLYLRYFGVLNPRMVEILEELILCFMKLEDYEEADKYLSIALESASALFTAEHPTLVRLRTLKMEVNEKLAIG